MKRATALGFLAVLVLLTVACPNNQNLVRQTAIASRDASIAILQFQNWEISAHNAGQVPDTDHQAVQTVLLKVATVGKILDARLRAVNTNADALTAVDGALSDITGIISTDLVKITSPQVKSGILVALTATQAALQSIHTMLSTVPKPTAPVAKTDFGHDTKHLTPGELAAN